MPMIDNRPWVRALQGAGRVRSCVDPGTLPAPAQGMVPWPRVEGMLLGLCIGDSLGNTSESMTPVRRREVLGEVRDYLPNRHAGGRSIGLPSDDTQLSFWTVEHLVAEGGLSAARLAQSFGKRGRIFGIGSTVRAFLAAQAAGAAVLESSQESAGNGALMRVAPMLLPHISAPTSALWADALLAGSITHNDFASNAACVAFVGVLWEALRAVPPVKPGFWLQPFVELARAVEGDEARYLPRSPSLSSGKSLATASIPAPASSTMWRGGHRKTSRLHECSILGTTARVQDRVDNHPGDSNAHRTAQHRKAAAADVVGHHTHQCQAVSLDSLGVKAILQDQTDRGQRRRSHRGDMPS